MFVYQLALPTNGGLYHLHMFMSNVSAATSSDVLDVPSPSRESSAPFVPLVHALVAGITLPASGVCKVVSLWRLPLLDGQAT